MVEMLQMNALMQTHTFNFNKEAPFASNNTNDWQSLQRLPTNWDPSNEMLPKARTKEARENKIKSV